MNHVYFEFDKNFIKLRELQQDDLPRSLRLFNIRIRLAIDIQIAFKGQISLTKSKEVRETYVLIIQLMEIWNAYEALSHYVGEVTDHRARNAGKSRVYSQAFLSQAGSLPTLKYTVDCIRDRHRKVRTFQTDFDEYVDRITGDNRLSVTLRADADTIRKYINDEKDVSGIELLSLIYAERNMYYHNGESAKMGMRYSNRKKLIYWFKEALLDQTLKVANTVVIEQIEANRQ